MPWTDKARAAAKDAKAANGPGRKIPAEHRTPITRERELRAVVKRLATKSQEK